MSRQENSRLGELNRHIDFLLDSGNLELKRQFPGTKSESGPSLIYPHLARTIIDGEINSSNFASEGYRRVQKEIEDYLGVKTIFQTCSHSDILPVNVAIPHVTLSHRRLGGFTKTKENVYGEIKLSDPVLAYTVDKFIRNNRRSGRESRFVEFAGTHINSFNPEQSCNQMITAAVKDKRDSVNKKIPTHGGLPVHFEELDRGFSAFREYARTGKAEGSTISSIYDAGTGMLIFGLKGIYDSRRAEMFDSEKTLRQNLTDLHMDGKILMTEFLAPRLKKTILAVGEANMLTMSHDYRDSRTLAANIINTSRIAKIVTEIERSKNNYGWIPKQLKEKEADWAIKAIAYEAVYNITANTWLGIKPQRSAITGGPSIVRAGPEGYPFNTGERNAVEVTAQGALADQQVRDIMHLYTPENTRIIFVTGRAEPGSDDVDPGEYLAVSSKQVTDNSKIIRDRLQRNSHKTAVIGALFDDNQRMVRIVPTEN